MISLAWQDFFLNVAPRLVKDPNPVADLTALLVTGRATEGLNDLLGGLSERVGDCFL